MNEIWLYENEVIYYGRSPQEAWGELPQGFRVHGFNYGFYSPQTGEVWGKRVIEDGEDHPWVYTPQARGNFLVPIEERTLFFPPEFLFFLAEHKELFQ